MRLFAVPAALLFLVVVANAQATAQARPGFEADRMSGERFLRAAGGVLAANALVWGANRFARDEPSARVGTRSWGRNLGTGFTWDADGRRPRPRSTIWSIPRWAASRSARSATGCRRGYFSAAANGGGSRRGP